MPLRSRAGLCAGELHDVSPDQKTAGYARLQCTTGSKHPSSRTSMTSQRIRGGLSAAMLPGMMHASVTDACACVPSDGMGKHGWSCSQASPLQQSFTGQIGCSKCLYLQN